MERVSILIDGGNFHHRALKLLGVAELDFDYDSFADFLVNDRKLIGNGKRYYVGTLFDQRDQKSRQAMSLQTKFLTRLSKTGWEIKTSKLRLRTEHIRMNERVSGYKKILAAGIGQIDISVLREKGIDVKLATDLLIGAFDNQYDVAILVSSDTDLTPAIDLVRKRFKKKLEYIGFSLDAPAWLKEGTKPSQSLINRSDIQRVLVKSDLEKFIIKTD